MQINAGVEGKLNFKDDIVFLIKQKNIRRNHRTITVHKKVISTLLQLSIVGKNIIGAPKMRINFRAK